MKLHKCKKCNIEKDLSNYYYYKSWNRYDYTCKDCYKIKNAKRQLWHYFNCDKHGKVKQTKTLKHCKKCKNELKFEELINKIKSRNKNFNGFVDLKSFPEKETSKIKCKCIVHGIYTASYSIIRDSKTSGCNKCRYKCVSNKLSHKDFTHKRCSRCKILKNINNFSIKKKKYCNTYYSYCFECDKKIHKEYVKKVGGHSALYKKRLKSQGKFYLKKNEKRKYNNLKSEIFYYYCSNCNCLSIGNSKTKNRFCRICKNKYGYATHKDRCIIYGTKYESFDKWISVYKRDKYICQYCGIKCSVNKKHYNDMNYITIDCIIPISKGGNYEVSNCVTCCRSCNSKKSDSLKWKPSKQIINNIQLTLFNNENQ